MRLELAFNITTDKNGVIDGRELAKQLITDAYNLLVPYVRACPACADDLFGIIANKVIEELHREGLEGGLMVVGEFNDAARAKVEAAHLDAARVSTGAMLAGMHHLHH